MPIQVTCVCGKTLAAPDNLAGRRAKCSACGAFVAIPAKTTATKVEKATAQANRQRPPEREGIGSLLDEVDLSQSRTGHRCPECRADLEPDDVICVQCGYSVETGKQLKTRKVQSKNKKLSGQHAGSGAASEKTAQTAPPEIHALVRLLNIVGGLAFVIPLGVILYLAWNSYQANPKADVIALATKVGGYALPILLGPLLLITVPASIATKKLYAGRPEGRLLSIVVGALSLPTVFGALVLKAALSDEIARYCR